MKSTYAFVLHFITLLFAFAVWSFIIVNVACGQTPPENEWQLETPAETTTIIPPSAMVCQNGAKPSCHPVQDILCWDWCNVDQYSYGDVFNPDGTKWKFHWVACKATLTGWIKHSEALQQQITTEQQISAALRAKCGKKCR